MTGRSPAGTWQGPAPAIEPTPPSPAELYATLLHDFGPKGWEIFFRRTEWQALHPSCGLLTSSSALGLREAIETAEQPRPLTGPAIIPASQRLLGHDGQLRQPIPNGDS